MNPETNGRSNVRLLKSIRFRALIVPTFMLAALGGALFATLKNFDALVLEISDAFEQSQLKRVAVSDMIADIAFVHSEFYRLLNLSLQGLDSKQLRRQGADTVQRLKEIRRKAVTTQENRQLADSEVAALKKIEATLGMYQGASENALKAITSGSPMANLYMVGVEQHFDQLLDDFADLSEQTSQFNLSAVLETANDSKVVILAAFAFTALLSLVIVMLALVHIAKAITEITAAMSNIAADHIDIPLPAVHRADEIGQMARTLNVFRDNAISLHVVNERLLDEMMVRERTEAELISSRSSLIEAQSIAQLGSWELDLQNNRLDWSDEVFRIFEIDNKGFGATFEAFLAAVHPDDRKLVKESYASSVKNKTLYDIEHRLLMEDGRVKYVNERCITEYDDHGDPLSSSGTVLDITNRKQADEKIRLLSQVVEQSPVSVVVTDTQAHLEYANATFEEVTGYSWEEVAGKNPRFLGSGNTPQIVYEEMWKAIAAGGSWDGEIENRKKNGELFWESAHFSAMRDESGVIRHYIAIKQDITQQKQQEERILYQAHYDALTSLPNRFLSLDRLSQLIKEAHRENGQVAVLFLDLDDFKKVNDSLGHETGDKLLIETAVRLKDVVRSGDTVGRLGGDEFIILLGGINDSVDAGAVAENIIDQFKNRAFRIDDRDLILTASVGIALYPDDGDSPSELLRNADSAMYHSKEQGRNTYSFFTSEMNRDVSRRLAIEEQMHGALERDEFEVVYQAKIEIETGNIMGAEALLRWRNPALENISPAEFIPIAEQTGLIVQLGEFVLNKALALAAKFRVDIDADFHIAVNLSPRQFRDPGLVEMIKKALETSGATSRLLELEITEGVLMGGHAYIDQALMAMSNLGISLAMDDFGTGYSSLSYLRSYPFDILKIDRSFIMHISVSEADRKLISATIAMAHGLNLKVVAEGIETEDQLSYLKGLSCDYGQGYLFSKPVSAESMAEILG